MRLQPDPIAQSLSGLQLAQSPEEETQFGRHVCRWIQTYDTAVPRSKAGATLARKGGDFIDLWMAPDIRVWDIF